jgi:hypothetical protein
MMGLHLYFRWKQKQNRLQNKSEIATPRKPSDQFLTFPRVAITLTFCFKKTKTIQP